MALIPLYNLRCVNLTFQFVIQKFCFSDIFFNHHNLFFSPFCMQTEFNCNKSLRSDCHKMAAGTQFQLHSLTIMITLLPEVHILNLNSSCKKKEERKIFLRKILEEIF